MVFSLIIRDKIARVVCWSTSFGPRSEIVSNSNLAISQPPWGNAGFESLVITSRSWPLSPMKDVISVVILQIRHVRFLLLNENGLTQWASFSKNSTRTTYKNLLRGPFYSLVLPLLRQTKPLRESNFRVPTKIPIFTVIRECTQISRRSWQLQLDQGTIAD